MTRRASRKPASGLVKPALVGQQQRLLQLACRRGLQRLEAAAFKLPVGRIAGSLAGNNAPPDHPAPMLHLEPGKLSGRGAAHGIDPPAQLPRRASPARRHHARAGTCGVLIRAAAGRVPATMLLTHLGLRAGHDHQPEAGGGGLPLRGFGQT
jgi:hypothetical protein